MSQSNYQDSQSSLIEFNMREDFTTLPQTECLTLILMTNGKAMLKINDKTVVLTAPCIFLRSPYDKVVLLENNRLAAKSFNFRPLFINKSFTFENLCNDNFTEISDEHDYNLLNPFFARDERFNGAIKPLPQTYLRISEWFDSAEKESKKRNDKYRLYRVRRYLLQILFLLEDAFCNELTGLPGESVMDIVLEHIHSNYSDKISLDSLCKLAFINRTSLARMFKAYTGRSPIEYLLYYRLNIACRLLTHSTMSIGKIAEMTGFRYENYMTRQFSVKIGMTPTQYRQSDGFETLNTKESTGVDEF